MSKLSTTAWVAHELGLGASFGGLLFGKLALNPNLDAIEPKPQRGKILNAAWNRYNVVNAVSVGTAVATWFAGRTGIRGRVIDEEARGLVVAKDALLATTVITGLASIVSGRRLTSQAPEGATPIDSGVSPAPEMSEEAARLLRTVNVLGDVNIALLGSVIVVSTLLSMRAGQSVRWSIASRLLP